MLFLLLALFSALLPQQPILLIAITVNGLHLDCLHMGITLLTLTFCSQAYKWPIFISSSVFLVSKIALRKKKKK